jgi:hypothetical protein
VRQLSSCSVRVHGTLLFRLSVHGIRSEFLERYRLLVLGSFFRVSLGQTSGRSSNRQIYNYDHQCDSYHDGCGLVPVRSGFLSRQSVGTWSSVSTSIVLRDANTLLLTLSSSLIPGLSAASTPGISCASKTGMSIGGITNGISTVYRAAPCSSGIVRKPSVVSSQSVAFSTSPTPSRVWVSMFHALSRGHLDVMRLGVGKW